MIRRVRPKHKALRIGRKTPRRFGYACTRTLTYSNIFRTTIIIGKIPGQPPEPKPFYAASQNAMVAAIHRAFRRQSVAFRASLLGIPGQARFTGEVQMRDISFDSSKTYPPPLPPQVLSDILTSQGQPDAWWRLQILGAPGGSAPRAEEGQAARDCVRGRARQILGGK